jgi:solute carrier family 39 (zinc transporter), member 1/2/3
MIHSFVIGLALSVSTRAEFSQSITTSWIDAEQNLIYAAASLATAITFHQLFEGLSLGTRIATLPVSTRSLPSILAIAFAITVPIGVMTGLCTLKGTHEDGKFQFSNIKIKVVTRAPPM